MNFTDGVEEPLYFENFDLTNIVTPVNIHRLQELLKLTAYNKKKSDFLIDGFSNGFSIGFANSIEGKRLAPNLKLRVGNETILWNKVMKEVKLNRFAGPYPEPPFENFIQSPIGLVPNIKEKQPGSYFTYPIQKMGRQSIHRLQWKFVK